MSAITFEKFDEQCIFDCYDYFFYHKYTHNHKTGKVHSFADALGSKNIHSDIEHLRQEQNDPTTSDASRLIAINVGHNLVSLCFTSIKLTDRVGEFIRHQLDLLYENRIRVSFKTRYQLKRFVDISHPFDIYNLIELIMALMRSDLFPSFAAELLFLCESEGATMYLVSHVVGLQVQLAITLHGLRS